MIKLMAGAILKKQPRQTRILKLRPSFYITQRFNAFIYSIFTLYKYNLIKQD